MVLELDYNPDMLVQGIDPDNLPATEERAPHFSHFLLSGVDFKNEALNLFLEQDRHNQPQDNTAPNPTPEDNTSLSFKNWHLPAILATAHELNMKLKNNQGDSIPQKTPDDVSAYANGAIADVAAIAQTLPPKEVKLPIPTFAEANETETVNINPDIGQFSENKSRHPGFSKNTQIKGKAGNICVFSSEQNEVNETDMKRSSYVQWLKSRGQADYADNEQKGNASTEQPQRQENENENSSFIRLTANESTAEEIGFIASDQEHEEKSPINFTEDSTVNSQNENVQHNEQENTEALTEQTDTKVDKKPDSRDFIRESVLPQDEIVSETLANLLAYHGHKNRAKKMYEQLSLLFPKKSSYFAQKIEKLDKN